MQQRLDGLENHRRQQEANQLANRAAQELQQAQQYQAWANHYRSLDPHSPQVAQCEQLAHTHHNRSLQLNAQAQAAYNGTYSQNQSQQLTGQAWSFANSDSGPLMNDPNPVDGRPYNQRGGLRPPLQRHQDDLSRNMPRNPDGSFVVNPDPRVGTWFGLANDGGPSFDPARGINCLDCMVSFWETWRGTPRVSAPRTYDSYQGTNPLNINRGEEHGMQRAAQLTGGQWQSLMPSTSPPQSRPNMPPAQTQQFVNFAYQGVASQLQQMGPGSAMFLVTEWEGGSSHAWLAINQGGDIVYVDAQTGRTSTTAPLYPHNGSTGNGNVAAMHAIPLDSNGNAQNIPNLGTTVQQMQQYLVNQAQQAQQPQQQGQQPQNQTTQQQQPNTQPQPNTQQQAQTQQSQQQQPNTQQAQQQASTQQNAQQQANTQQTQQAQTQQPNTQQAQTQQNAQQQANTQQQVDPEVTLQVSPKVSLQKADPELTQPVQVEQQVDPEVTQQVSPKVSLQKADPELTQPVQIEQQVDPEVTQQVSPKVSLQKADPEQTQPVQVQQQAPVDPRIAYAQEPGPVDPRIAFQQGTQQQGTQQTPPPSQAPGSTPPPSGPPPSRPRAHRPPDPAGMSPGSIPFGYEEFFNDPRWAEQALAFEQAVGARLFNDPAVLQAARDSLVRLQDVMRSLNPSMTEADIQRTFFPGTADDANILTSAGQAGPGTSMDDLLERGNVREVMTAFFNGAYAVYTSPTFSNLLQQAITTGDLEPARQAGVNTEVLQQIRDEIAANRELAATDPRTWGDIFSLGIVNLISDHGVMDLLETGHSHDGRRNRDDDVQAAMANTARHYADLGTPLGEFERAFLERELGRPLTDDEQLPWREGHTLLELNSQWVRELQARGFPTAAGISMTTTRMLTAARLLGLDADQQQQFMNGLMAWMLPCRDHSLAEIYRAAMISNIERVTREQYPDLSVVEMYREMTGMDLASLRDEVGVQDETAHPDPQSRRGLLPHEARYLERAFDGTLGDVTPQMRQIAQQAWHMLATGDVSTRALQEFQRAHGQEPTTAADRRHAANFPGHLREWLQRNGIDPNDSAAVRGLTDRLSMAHMISFSVYTGFGYGLINGALTGRMESEDAPCARRIADALPELDLPPADDTAVERGVRTKAEALVDKYIARYTAAIDRGRTPDQAEPRHIPDSIRAVMHTEAGDRWRDALQRHRQAVRLNHELFASGDDEAARAVGREIAQAQADMRAAVADLHVALEEALPGIIAEMKWHADMIMDGVRQLPHQGSEESPRLVYRGDGADPDPEEADPLYGSRTEDPGAMPKVVSTTVDLEQTIIFMGNDDSIDDSNRVVVVYQLTGQYSADIAPFSVYPAQEEVLLPPGSQVHRVDDPEAAQRLREEIMALSKFPDEWKDDPNGNQRFRVIIMREGEAPGESE